MTSIAKPVVWQVLSNEHRFGIFFIGAAASNVGTWCQNLATVLLVYRLSGSTFETGLVSVAQFSAPMVLSPLAGSVCDVVDRRVVLTCTQLCGAALSCGLGIATMVGHVSVPVVLGVVFLLGVNQSFQSPAQLSIAPLMVSDDHREIGLSLNSSQFNVARAMGPVVANAIVLAWGVGQAFLFNTFTFFAYIAVLQVVRPREAQRATGRPRVREILGVLRSERLILPLLFVGFITSGATDVMATVGPALSSAITGHDSGTGWIISTFGLGAVISAFFLVPCLRRFPRRLAPLIAANAVGIALMGAAPQMWAACVGSFIAGAAFLAGSNRALGLVQGLVPATHLGRVMGLWMIAYVGGRPIFALIEGGVAHLGGPRAAVGVVALAVVATAWLVWVRGAAWGSPRAAIGMQTNVQQHVMEKEGR